MKKFLFIVILLIFIIGNSFMIYKYFTDDYIKEREYVCKVLKKIDHNYEVRASYGHHYQRDFVLILSSDGKQFALDVNPATWAMADINDTFIFKLAPYQLDMYQASPVRWGTYSFLSIIVSLLLIVVVYQFIFKVEW